VTGKTKFEIYLIIFIFFSLCVSYQGCDGIFPAQSKPTVPSDHTDNISGAFHKPNPQNIEDCKPCHGPDLKGGTTNINGQWVFVNSCYQCHADLWSGRGGGGGTGGLPKFKIIK